MTTDAENEIYTPRFAGSRRNGFKTALEECDSVVGICQY
jgi:hypothetical protein